MPRIYVQFPELTRLGEQCTTISKQLDTLQSDVQHTVQRLDWDVKFQDDIYSTGRQIARRLGCYAQALNGYNAFLKDAHDRYIQLDQEAERDRSNIWGLPFWSPGHVPPIVQPPVPCPFLFTLPKWLKPADPVEDIKSFLDALNALLDQDAFGILKDITSYFQDLFAFLTGDKKGMTGACDWLDLTDSSFQLWDGFYDYFRKLYEGKGDFFSDIAQKRVKSIGIATGLLGLLSSVLSASQGLDEKQWTSIVSDYVNSGKDVIPVVDAIYSLRHIGDTNSLAEVKDGPWSALDVYGAVGEAGISAISQGFRSFEQYYQDGRWDWGDTGATGIDVSMAGLYGLSHKLTWGLDDLIFRLVDGASGGDGTSDMTYYEKAAAGYKYLASECGKAVADLWLKLHQ